MTVRKLTFRPMMSDSDLFTLEPRVVLPVLCLHARLKPRPNRLSNTFQKRTTSQKWVASIETQGCSY